MTCRLLPLLSALALGLGGALRGEETADFGDALGRLAGLDLPDLEGAVWEDVPEVIRNGSCTSQYPFQSAEIRLRGAQWRTPDGNYVDFGSSIVTPGPENPPGEGGDAGAPSAGGVLSEMIRRYQANRPEDEKPEKDEPPKPKKTLLEKDLDAILGKLEGSKVTGESDPFGDDDEIGALSGRLLLFAAQLHQAGHTDPANRLTSAIFATGADPAGVIDAAVSELAEERFAAVNRTFFDDYDWKSYHEGLVDVTERFSRGWDKRLAVAMLLPGVEARARGEAVPEPALPDIELPTEALAEVRKWCEPPSGEGGPTDIDTLLQQRYPGIDLSEFPAEMRQQIIASLRENNGFGNVSESNPLWTLNQPPEDGTPDAVAGPTRIQHFGMDGLIVLAAVAGDPTLTYHRNNGGRTSYYWSSNSSPIELARQEFERMERPMSRGELATGMLKPVVPGDFDDADTELLREAAVDFWKTHRDAPPVEMCRTYLNDGSSSQRSLALGALVPLAAENDEARQLFERFTLESGEPFEILSEVQEYLAQRKAAARDYFERFADLLRDAYEAIPEDERNYRTSYEIREAKGIEPYLKQLAVLVGASSLGELITDACKAGPDDADAWDSLSGSLQGIAIIDLMAPFGEAITQAEPPIRTRLLEALLDRCNEWTGRDTDSALVNGDFPADLATLWGPLLDDDRSMVDPDTDDSWFPYYGGETIGICTAILIEFACNASAEDEMDTSVAVHDDVADHATIVMARARARIAGSGLPAYPSADGVPEERQAEIAKLADENGPIQLREAVLALDPSERAAWIAWKTGLGEDEDATVPESILALRNTVTVIDDGEDSEADGDRPDPKVARAAGIEPGMSIDGPALEALVTRLLESSEQNPGTVIHFVPASLNLGLRARAYQAGETRQGWLRFLASQDAVGESEAEAFALAAVDGGQRLVVWERKDGKVAALTEKEDDQYPAFKLLSDFLESPNPYVPSFTVGVLRRDELPQFENEDENDE